MNRAETNGPNGIWGHVLDDLVLYEIKHDGHGNITLGVDS